MGAAVLCGWQDRSIEHQDKARGLQLMTGLEKTIDTTSDPELASELPAGARKALTENVES